jgi:glutathione S-transferase
MAETSRAPIVFGATYSVYVRIVRLALEEKGIPYSLEEVDIFAPGGPPPGYLERHPFGRIPAFEHDGFRLFEAAAICRYVDDAFAGPAQTPADLRSRALMAQTIGMLDSYAYRAMVWDLYVELIAKPREGGVTDPAIVARGLKTAGIVVDVLESQCRRGGFLVGEELSLADLHAWPMVDDFLLTDAGAELINGHPGVKAWAAMMADRPAVLSTAFPDD